jgi:hypothetical protein
LQFFIFVAGAFNACLTFSRQLLHLLLKPLNLLLGVFILNLKLGNDVIAMLDFGAKSSDV